MVTTFTKTPLVGEVLQCNRDPHNTAVKERRPLDFHHKNGLLALLTEVRRYNRLHGNWGEKTLRKGGLEVLVPSP